MRFDISCESSAYDSKEILSLTFSKNNESNSERRLQQFCSELTGLMHTELAVSGSSYY